MTGITNILLFFKCDFCIIDIDHYGSIVSLHLSNKKKLPSRTILIAIGTSGNKFIDIDGIENLNSDIFKNKANNLSYFGDCNQKYSGSVVKALASVKNGYKEITTSLQKRPPKLAKVPEFNSNCIIHKVSQLSDNITEITIYSKTCASNFKPGQFFRLQNYAKNLHNIVEPIAITAVEVHNAKNLLTFIVQNVGKSSKLISKLKKGDNIILMGPTGLPTKIFSKKNVLLIGGGIGSAILIPIAKALKKHSCNINFVCGYKKHSDLIYLEKIESVSDNLIMSFQQDPNNPETIIDALNRSKTNNLLDNIDYIYCNGSNTMMEAVLEHKDSLFPNVEITYSINSPMQCMMKGICGQCIQKTNNKDGYVFSCACQDLEASSIDFQCLNNRLSLNSLFEKVYRVVHLP